MDKYNFYKVNDNKIVFYTAVPRFSLEPLNVLKHENYNLWLELDEIIDPRHVSPWTLISFTTNTRMGITRLFYDNVDDCSDLINRLNEASDTQLNNYVSVKIVDGVVVKNRAGEIGVKLKNINYGK